MHDQLGSFIHSITNLLLEDPHHISVHIELRTKLMGDEGVLVLEDHSSVISYLSFS